MPVVPTAGTWGHMARSRRRFFSTAGLGVVVALSAAAALPECACSEEAAERGPAIQNPQDEIEEYWILLRALAEGGDTPRQADLATAQELLAARDLPAVLPRLLRDASLYDKRLLATALGRSKDVRVVPFLIEMFRDSEAGPWVHSALVALGEPAAERLWAAVPVPEEAATFPDVRSTPVTREAWCASALRHMGPTAVPFLVGKLQSGEAGERRKALSLLAWMYYTTFDLVDWPPDVVADLRLALDAPDGMSRMAALLVLGHIEDRPTIESCARRMQADPDRNVAAIAGAMLQNDSLRANCSRAAARSG